jgi:plastocyanin
MNSLRLFTASLVAALAFTVPGLAQNTHTVQVAPSGFSFEPQDLNINVGDTVLWVWNGAIPHNVNSDDGAFFSGAPTVAPNTFSVTFDNTFLAANPVAGDFYGYHCQPHQLAGMVGSIQVLPTRLLTSTLVAGQTGNISTSGSIPGNTVIIAYSFSGAGTIPIVYGSLALSPPINQLPPRTADGSGRVLISVNVPIGMAGTTVHLHAAEILGPGNGILTTPLSVTL